MAVDRLGMLAVCDGEKEYCLQLSLYAKACGNFPFQVQPFTAESMLQDYRKHRDVDAVLLEESLYDPEHWKDYSGVLCLLGNGVGENAGVPRVYKYQPVRDVLAEIMAEYNSRIPQRKKGMVQKRGMEIYGVYSPVGRCGKSSFALALGLELARTDHALYLNLEAWPALEALCSLSGEWTISDFLYYLRERRSDLMEKLQPMLVGIGQLETIRPAASPGDLAVATAADWRFFFEQLRCHSGYTAVILDIGDCFQPVEELLALCTTVYLPVKDDPAAQAKLQRFISFLEKVRGTEILGNFCRLHLPDCPTYAEPDFYGEKLLWGPMGNYVRTLLGRKGEKYGSEFAETEKKSGAYAGRKRGLYGRRSTAAD